MSNSGRVGPLYVAQDHLHYNAYLITNYIITPT